MLKNQSVRLIITYDLNPNKKPKTQKLIKKIFWTFNKGP